MKEEQEFMMNSIDPTNQMYFEEVDSGWSVGMQEEPGRDEEPQMEKVSNK